MKLIKKVCAIFITGSAFALTIVHWQEPESLAWLVAFAGWVDHCFRNEE
jgi:hypothetical protein